MFKGVKVSYPKRKTKAKNLQAIGIQEPVRKSMYDTVIENLKLADRKTFIHRIIYIGEHSFTKLDNELIDYIYRTIQRTNDDFHISERLTGLLVRYPRHIIHLIEGDEDCINLHLKFLLEDEKYSKRLKNMKLVLSICHVHNRLLPDWSFYNGTPAKLLETIQTSSPLEETRRQICVCVKKMYDLVYAMSCRGSEFSEEGLSLNQDSGIFLRSSQQLGVVASSVYDTYRRQLPETERLTYIMHSEYPLNLVSYWQLFNKVQQRDIYKDKVWPVPADFIPYDIFSTPYSPIVEFPKHKPENDSKKEQIDEDFEDDDVEQVTKEKQSDIRLFSESSMIHMSPQTASTFDIKRRIIPEEERLNYIIRSAYPIGVHVYYKLFNTVPQRDIYKDKVWPVPADFVPYDIFSTPYDPIVEMPKVISTNSTVDTFQDYSEIEDQEESNED